MSWIQQNLEWAVGLLLVGIIVLFFFPLLLGYQLKEEEDSNDQWKWIVANYINFSFGVFHAIDNRGV